MAFPTSYGSEQGRRLLLVKEVTKGTRVPVATAIWRGPVEGFVAVQSPVFPPENIGYVAGLDRAYVPYKYATLKIPSTELTFEQGPYPFAMGVQDVVSGTVDGAGSDYMYSYTLSRTFPYSDIKTYSLESGDDQSAMIAAYAFCEQIVLTGTAKEAWKIEANLITRPAAPLVYTASTIAFTNSTSITDSANGFVTAGFSIGDKIVVTGTVSNNGTYTITNVAAGTLTVTEATATEAAGTPFTLTITFTSGITPATTDVVPFSTSKLYIDAIGGTLGTTQIQGTLQSAKVTINTGRVALASADGDGNGVATFSGVALDATKQSMQIDMTLYSVSNALAERLDYINKSERLIHLVSEGPAVATAGTTYSKKSLVVDAAGYWTAWPAFSAVDGNNVWNATFTARMNISKNLMGRVVFVNELSALV